MELKHDLPTAPIWRPARLVASHSVELAYQVPDEYSVGDLLILDSTSQQSVVVRDLESFTEVHTEAYLSPDGYWFPEHVLEWVNDGLN